MNLGKFLVLLGYCLTWVADFVSLDVPKSVYRRKRVVYGEQALEPSEYLATKYFVWIGRGNECDIQLRDLRISHSHIVYDIPIPSFGYICNPSPSHLWCTGALLMPRVVQTACHCLAEYIHTDFQISRGFKKNINEARYHVYPGKGLLSEVNGGVAAERYLIHPRCADEKLATVYDYGLIVLADPMDKYQTTYAPVYSVKDLVRLWTDLMSKRKVCLTLGYGGYKAKEGPFSREASPVLLHGWMLTMDYYTCFDITHNALREQSIEHYREMGTWFCSIKMPTNHFSSAGTGFGDSGGPISCDNEYMGVVSTAFNNDKDKNGPIAFTILENSADYRQRFVEYLKDTEDVLYTTSDPIGYKYVPTVPPITKSYLKPIHASLAIRPCLKLPFLIVIIIFIEH